MLNYPYRRTMLALAGSSTALTTAGAIATGAPPSMLGIGGVLATGALGVTELRRRKLIKAERRAAADRLSAFAVRADIDSAAYIRGDYRADPITDAVTDLITALADAPNPPSDALTAALEVFERGNFIAKDLRDLADLLWGREPEVADEDAVLLVHDPADVDEMPDAVGLGARYGEELTKGAVRDYLFAGVAAQTDAFTRQVTEITRQIAAISKQPAISKPTGPFTLNRVVPDPSTPGSVMFADAARFWEGGTEVEVDEVVEWGGGTIRSDARWQHPIWR